CLLDRLDVAAAVAVLLQRDGVDQRQHERQRDHDDRDDLDQLRGVRAVQLERGRQDVAQAPLGDRPAAACARGWWWRGRHPAVVEPGHTQPLLKVYGEPPDTTPDARTMWDALR